VVATRAVPAGRRRDVVASAAEARGVLGGKSGNRMPGFRAAGRR
jgi:hypothetical protein